MNFILIFQSVEKQSGSVGSVNLGVNGLLVPDSLETLRCVLEQNTLSSP